MSRGQFQAIVSSNSAICREHFRLILEVEGFGSAEPGQFVQIACRDLENQDGDVELEWRDDRLPSGSWNLLETQALLRRPFSLAGCRDLGGGRSELQNIHRVVGIGTQWLSELRPGEHVNVLGPLGNGFELPGNGSTALLVAGGVGIPPILFLAERLKGIAAVAFCGATTKDLLPLKILPGAPTGGDETSPRPIIEEFARYGIPSVVSTDDGSFGFGGFVTQALDRYLDRSGVGRQIVIYTCGPEAMMKRVAEIADLRGIGCQVAVERTMACGMGTCQSCAIRVRKTPAGDDWIYKLSCTDGPVFRSADLLW